MGIFRSYFDKNNTIIRGSDVNTAHNPVAELAYGKRVTRMLINIDLADMRKKYQETDLVINENTRHTLKLRSTQDFSILPNLNEFKNLTLDSSSRPTSFDMELHPIEGAVWDEGVGYDFALSEMRRAEELDYVKGPSNWLNATSQIAWNTPGAVATGSTAIATQHFDKGNEDVEMDITAYVNNIVTGTTGTSAFNVVLKYADVHENMGGDTEYVAGFFTKYTQTFFEPFLETVYDDIILDDRQKFYLNKKNRLYLYVNIGGKLTNLDEIPICTVGTTQYPVFHQSKGVYYTNINAFGNVYISEKKYFDVWSNLKVGGKILADVKMDFITKDEKDFYQLQDEMVLPERYGLSLSGIKQEEKITLGEKRRVNVLVRKPYTVNQSELITDMQYRVYVKVGPAQLTVVDWSEVSRSNLHNFFTLDTSWMIPNKYYVDIRVQQNGETLLYNDQLVFNIVSRRKM